MLQWVVCEALPSSRLRDEGFFHPGPFAAAAKAGMATGCAAASRLRSKADQKKGEHLDAVR
ncbi:MAG: hypothetical protein HDT27_10810 [Subdoligranulum sp.]|nr:hypothetical protein [Subdoligranulum sp.]